jgi:tetratricopeptide (TPR) repeat protein
MSNHNLDDLLLRLQSLPPGTALSDVMSSIMPQDSVPAMSQVALVRWFDPEIYNLLCDGLDGVPDFEAFTALPGITRLAPGRWHQSESSREPLLAAWQNPPSLEKWRQWNGRLTEHFHERLEELGLEAKLAVVYHAAAGPQPAALVEIFRDWFAAADNAFDMASANALLEMLKLQAQWRGEALSKLYAELRAYCDTRLLFTDDYYKTGAYLERTELLDKFLSVKDRKPGQPIWVFHLHASGGTGKTMFIRWLLSRKLVPDRILCARVDFDDFRLNDVLEYPIRLFRQILDQLARQPGGEDFRSLAEKFAVAEVSGWPPILAEANRQLASTQASAQGLSVVVILDTLEEATLSAAEWLEKCISALREWLHVLPGLTLVLSGRYNLASRSHALKNGEYLGYELPRFSDVEARRYLKHRGLQDGEVLEAILERSSVEDTETEQEGRNPFKLSMFAELALNNKTLTATEVLAYPRVDIAYLIERVVKRIDSQPLRWMVRYGAVARELNLRFAKAVLLPRLLEALRGETADQPEEGLDGGPDVWRQDPEQARNLMVAGGMEALWDQLNSYSRERGWLSKRIDHGEVLLRLHPEVVNPVRELLQQQPIYAQLQQQAWQWCDTQAQEAATRLDCTAAVRGWREAVFHRFQAEGHIALAYWRECLKAARRFGPEAMLPLALEPVGRDYAEAEIMPLPGISSSELLVEAHSEAAWLYLEADGWEFMAAKHWPEFATQVDRALEAAIRGSPEVEVNGALTALREAWKGQEPLVTAERLASAIACTHEPRERLMLKLQRGRALVLQGSPAAGEAFREVLLLQQQVAADWLPATVIHLEQAKRFARQGFHVAVRESLREARRWAADDPILLVRAQIQEIAYALEIGEVAQEMLSELVNPPVAGTEGSSPAAQQNDVESSPTAPLIRAERELLKAHIWLALLQPSPALDIIRQVSHWNEDMSIRARCHELAGVVMALTFDFRCALEEWETATNLYERLGDRLGIIKCVVQCIALKAKTMGNLRDASAQLQETRLPEVNQDPAGAMELAMLRLYLDIRMGRELDVSTLLPLPEGLPAVIRARVFVFLLGFDLVPLDALFLEELEASLMAVQPLTLRGTALDWLAYVETTGAHSEETARRLLALLPLKSSHNSEVDVSLAIRRADLWRVLGRPELAARELARIEIKTIVGRWQLELAKQRTGLPTCYEKLAADVSTSEYGDTFLSQVIIWEAEAESVAPSIHPLELSSESMGEREWQQPANHWQARYLASIAQRSAGRDVDLLLRLAALQEELGLPLTPHQSDSEEKRHEGDLKSKSAVIVEIDSPTISSGNFVSASRDPDSSLNNSIEESLSQVSPEHAEEAVATYRKLAATIASFLPDLARSLNNLGNRYSELGRRADALPPTEEAVRIRRELSQSNPVFLPDLAGTIINLGNHYSNLGRREDALKPTQEAVGIYRELSQSNPVYLPDLAMALNNLGNRYSELGRREDALKSTEEAVRIRRELSQSNPAFLPDLAGALNNLGNHYSNLGRREDALKPTQEAVGIYGELSQSNPVFLPNLAMALNNLGNRFSELGHREEALKPTEEAVGIRRKLLQSNPAFVPDLAGALNNLGNRYSELGRREEALKPTEEAVGIYRELSQSNPAFVPDLAGALNNLGNHFSNLGRREEALKPTHEAVGIYGELSQSNPAFLPDLAMALNNLGNRYSELGRREEALKPTQEAVAIYRELSQSNPAFLPDLAGALNNLGIRYSELGRREEALKPTQEAEGVYRELSQSNPAFLPGLASALNNLGICYVGLGRLEEALKPTQEAVGIYRELSQSNPVFLADLAGVLNNLGIRYSELGRREEALKPTEEAVTIRRKLAATNSAFLPELASSLNALGISYTALGRIDEALQPTQEAEKIQRKLSRSNPAEHDNLKLSIIWISDSAASKIKTSLEPAFAPVIDQILADWQGLATELGGVLKDLDAAESPAVETSGALAAMPWELAGAVNRVHHLLRIGDGMPRSRHQNGVIRLISFQEEEEVDYASTTGSRLEDVYAQFGVTVEKIEAVPVQRLHETLQHNDGPPVLLHLVASMREGQNDAVFLDFGGTLRRSDSYGPTNTMNSDTALEETTLSVERLDRLASIFPEEPFVVLDIARPSNQAEAVRMLLLRNLFASRLFERGHVRGILGCGLAIPDQRLLLASRWIEALLLGSPAGARHALSDGVPADLDACLAQAAAALWSNAPTMPLFVEGRTTEEFTHG